MLVLNKHRDKLVPGAIYIGRGSLFGNPYRLSDYDNDRQVVMDLFRVYLDRCLRTNPYFMTQFAELAKAPAVVCFCKPLPCHGDILVAKMVEMGLLNGAIS